MNEYTCPDCRAGKHDICLGDAWDTETDQPTTCDCWMTNHRKTSD